MVGKNVDTYLSEIRKGVGSAFSLHILWPKLR
jgi:hypothetical protein